MCAPTRTFQIRLAAHVGTAYPIYFRLLFAIITETLGLGPLLTEGRRSGVQMVRAPSLTIAKSRNGQLPLRGSEFFAESRVILGSKQRHTRGAQPMVLSTDIQLD